MFISNPGGGPTYTTFSAAYQNLAVSTVLDLRPMAGKRRTISTVCDATQIVLILYDGTHEPGGVNTTPIQSVGVSAVGPALVNTDGSNAHPYSYAGWDATP